MSDLPPSQPGLLAYAPPLRNPKRPLAVIAGGLATTILTLVVVGYLDANTEANPMGWYANGILPIGALLVGVCAGIGYGLVSWLTGVKIGRGLMWTVLGLQVIAYGAARYSEFAIGGPWVTTSGRQVGFGEYFHETTVNMTMTSSRSYNRDKEPEPLGMWGYGIRSLELLGFAVGGLVAPLVLHKKPYCDLCQVYMKSRVVGKIPATLAMVKPKKSDVAGQSVYEQQQRDAFEQALQTLEQLRDAATRQDIAAFKTLSASVKGIAKQADKLPARLRVTLVHCRNCRSGYLGASVVSGQGQNVKEEAMPSMELNPDFVRAVEG